VFGRISRLLNQILNGKEGTPCDEALRYFRYTLHTAAKGMRATRAVAVHDRSNEPLVVEDVRWFWLTGATGAPGLARLVAKLRTRWPAIAADLAVELNAVLFVATDGGPLFPRDRPAPTSVWTFRQSLINAMQPYLLCLAATPDLYPCSGTPVHKSLAAWSEALQLELISSGLTRGEAPHESAFAAIAHVYTTPGDKVQTEIYKCALGAPAVAAGKLWTWLAEQGHADAQHNFGRCYEFGTGVVQDDATSATLYQLAAEQGHAGAQFSLGECYARGTGVVQGAKRAAELYQLAAKQGHAGAQFSLGECYARGTGVVQDVKRAAELYQLAAEQGHAVAQHNLGERYAGGTGVVQDAKRAAELYQLVADQHTALMFAIIGGDEIRARALIEAGANIATGKNGWTALMLASTMGHEPCARALIEAGANINATGKDGRTALTLAFNHGHEPCVRALIEAGANINATGKDGCTALMFASSNGHEPCARALIEAGANINATKAYGWTAFMIASENGHEPCAFALIEAGANINATDVWLDRAHVRFPTRSRAVRPRPDRCDWGSWVGCDWGSWVGCDWGSWVGCDWGS